MDSLDKNVIETYLLNIDYGIKTHDLKNYIQNQPEIAWNIIQAIFCNATVYEINKSSLSIVLFDFIKLNGEVFIDKIISTLLADDFFKSIIQRVVKSNEIPPDDHKIPKEIISKLSIEDSNLSLIF